MVWGLVVPGGNNLEVTTMLFETLEKGLAHVEPHFGKGTKKTEDGKVKYVWAFGKKMNDNDPKGKIFLTHYYSGCGGVWGFELRELPFGEPFCGFDLD